MAIGFGTKVILTILLAGISTIASGIFERMSLNEVLGLTAPIQEPVWTVEEIADSVATTNANEAYSILFELLSKLKKASEAQSQGSYTGESRAIIGDEVSRHCYRTYARVSRLRRSTMARMRKFQTGLDTLARAEERETLRLRTAIEGQRLVSAENFSYNTKLWPDLESSLDRQSQIMQIISTTDKLVGQCGQLFDMLGAAANRETDYRRYRRLENELHTRRNIPVPEQIESEAWDLLNRQRLTERELVDILCAMGAYPADLRRFKSTGQPNWIEITSLIVQIEAERQALFAPIG